MSQTYVVYEHIRPDTRTVFYVGKGKGDRCNNRRRSEYWRRTVEKHGFTVHIFMRFGIEACAFSLEKALIKHYGRHNLCNLTDGGEGTSGRVVTQSQKDKCSISNKGNRPSSISISKAVKRNSKAVGTKCGLRFSSAAEAARSLFPDTNIRTAKCSISASCRGYKVSNAYGYEFRFLVNGVLQETTFRPKPTGVSVKSSCGMLFQSATYAAKWLMENGFPKAQNGNIIQNCKGKVKYAYGYKWSYA